MYFKMNNNKNNKIIIECKRTKIRKNQSKILNRKEKK